MRSISGEEGFFASVRDYRKGNTFRGKGMEERKVPASFRKVLGEELILWEQEALITPEAASHLREHYRLGGAADRTAGVFLSAIYVFGALLIGGGVISLVASHWESLAAPLKVVLLIAAMAGAHGWGFYVWKVKGNAVKLGHALIVLGTLIFGANIWLFAQVFHIHSNYYEGFGAWALGAMGVAVALGSQSNALIALIASFIWFSGWIIDGGKHFGIYPFIVAAVFVPFVISIKSRFFLAWTAVAIATSLAVCGGSGGGLFGFSLACVAASSLLYSWGLIHDAGGDPGFSGILRFLGNLCICVIAYLLSYRAIAEMITVPSFTSWGYEWWAVPIEAALGLCMILWVLGLRARTSGSEEEDDSSPRSRIPEPFVAGGLLIMAGGIAFIPAIPGEIAANLSCLVLAGGLVRRALATGERRFFWCGLLFFGLVVVSRFFEWDTGLLAKALALMACGAGILYCGVLFEKHLKKRAQNRQSHA
jgi:uncharacterized membrane protein